VISQMMAATIIIFMAMIALMIVVDGIQIKALTETLSQPKNLIPAILLIFITLGAFNFLMDLNRKIKEKIKQ
jgi:TRAP-type C4-dicarboxylate transport system permease small subunit